MAVPVSSTDFRALIERSRLVAPSFLDTALSSDSDPDELLRRLLDVRLLTPFQADQLSKGRADSFFLTDKYKILDYIGAGGMGKVYLCEHLLLHRLVAVKLLHPGASTGPDSARAFERFYREARAVAALNDPNIIRVFDVDRAGGSPFMVMEYADGSNLHEIVSRHGALDFHRAADYIRQAALGLQHAFDIGLVHRDIKPGNLILDRVGTVRVLDLGLARFSQDQSRNQSITEKYDKHKVLGTVDFMSPEQAFEPEQVDIRADIYGLGCTLYYLVTGKVPFPDRTATEKMFAHKSRAPEPVSEICPRMPFELLQILERMMAKEREERFQTPMEVVEALAEFGGQADLPPAKEMPEHPAPFYRLGLSPTPDVGSSDAATPNPLSQLDTDAAPLPGWVSPGQAMPLPTSGLRPGSTRELTPTLLPSPHSRRRRGAIRLAEWLVFIIVAGVVGWLVSRKWNHDEPRIEPAPSAPIVPKADAQKPFVGVILNAGGSTFVNPVMQLWATSYEQARGVKIDYRANGSGIGVQGILDGVYLFGCSDVALTDEQLAEVRSRGGEVVHVPLVMGAVAVAYNLPDVNQRLQFTGPVLASLYFGKITRWNDPALEACNPGVKLPNLPITVLRRSDASGTTYIWTDYLSKASADWKLKVGAGTEVSWPVGIEAKGNNGVATAISRQVGAIGYVEQSYALENNLPVGLVKNHGGKYIAPSLESVTAAAAEVTHAIPDDLRFTLTDSRGETAYPIAGTAWAILYVDQTDRASGKDLVAFLRWATHEGQALVGDLKYAPLPLELVKKIDERLNSVRVK